MAFVHMSFTKTSTSPLLSPTTRLSAKLSKATYRPSAEMAAFKLKSLPGVPSAAADTSFDSPVDRSYQMMSPGPSGFHVRRSKAFGAPMESRPDLATRGSKSHRVGYAGR